MRLAKSEALNAAVPARLPHQDQLCAEYNDVPAGHEGFFIQRAAPCRERLFHSYHFLFFIDPLSAHAPDYQSELEKE
jgi:hypothetical protein